MGMADILNDALEEVDQEKSTKVRYSYEPDPSFNSSKKQFKIPKDIIAAIDVNGLPVDDLLNYLRKTIVVQSQQCPWMQLQNGQKNKIIRCDFRQNNPMFCVMREEFIRPNPQNGVEISPFYRSELVEIAMNPAAILTNYGISSHAVPPSFRQAHLFSNPFQQKDKIRSFIVEGAFKMKQIVKKTKWNKVPIKNYEHKKQRMEYIVKKQVFVDNINELNDYSNPTLIPIVMFDKESIKFWIEFVWIVKIRQDSHIGISMIYNAKKRRVEIKGIHTDKQLILNQHQLISPLFSDYFVRDFEFSSKIDHLKIAELGADKNRIFQLKNSNSALRVERQRMETVIQDLQNQRQTIEVSVAESKKSNQDLQNRLNQAENQVAYLRQQLQNAQRMQQQVYNQQIPAYSQQSYQNGSHYQTNGYSVNNQYGYHYN